MHIIMKKPTRYELERRSLKNRPRKVLNLEERVLAIRLYRRNPIYQRVASVFKCSWEQIRNIILNRDDIIDYYGRSRIITTNDPPNYVRNKKINFLGQVTYEFIRRAHYHRSAPLNDEMLRKRAFEFRDILEIEQFFPNKAWINDFKKVYNIDWTRIDSLVIGEKPPQTLNSKEIVNYCRRLVDRMLAMHGEVMERSGKRAERKTDDELMHEYQTELELIANAEVEPDAETETETEAAAADEEEPIDMAELQYDAMDFELGSNLLDCDVRVAHESIDFAGIYAEEFDAVSPQQEQPTFECDNNGNEMPTTTQQLNELQIKQERCSLTPSPVQNSIASPSPPQSSPMVAANENSNDVLTEPVPHPMISSYAEALQALRPLEDFATNVEDFRALNLLTQLVEVFERNMRQEEEEQRRPKTLYNS